MQNNEINAPKDKNIRLEGFTKKQVLKNFGHDARVVAISKSRNLLAARFKHSSVKLWNLNTNGMLRSYKFHGDVQDIAFSNDGNLLAFCGCSDTDIIKLFDISDLSHLKKNQIMFEFKRHNDTIQSLTFSNDSNYLISGSIDKTVRIWNMKTKKYAYYLYSGDYVFDVAISGDDTLLASNSLNGKIRIWNFQNQKLLCTQQAHMEGAAINFSNDQKMLVSSEYDNGIIKLWSLKQLNQRKLLLIRKFRASYNTIQTVLFFPCSGFIIFRSNMDRKIKVINLQTCKYMGFFKCKAIQDSDGATLAISKDLDIIAYGEDTNILVLRKK